VLLQEEVLVDVVHVRDVVGFRDVPDHDVTKVTARDEALTVVVGGDGSDFATVRLVDDVHWTTGLRVETADTTVTPSCRHTTGSRSNVAKSSQSRLHHSIIGHIPIKLYRFLISSFRVFAWNENHTNWLTDRHRQKIQSFRLATQFSVTALRTSAFTTEYDHVQILIVNLKQLAEPSCRHTPIHSGGGGLSK